MTSGEARATPFYCPYCGEETLRPFGDEPEGAPGSDRGAWRCESCARAFSIRYRGLTGTTG